MTDLFGIHEYWAFIGAVLVFLALPGPGTFCILASTGRNGLAGGFACLCGIILGDQVLMWLAVAGVAALLQAHPAWFHGLQFLGAMYLCYIGIGLLRARGGEGAQVVPFPAARDFRRGFLVTLVNPKAIVFYMAFFPLFIHPETHRGMVTFVAMAGSIAVCTVLYGGLLVLVGNLLAGRLRGMPRVTGLANKVAGVILVGFGIRLTFNF